MKRFPPVSPDALASNNFSGSSWSVQRSSFSLFSGKISFFLLFSSSASLILPRIIWNCWSLNEWWELLSNWLLSRVTSANERRLAAPAPPPMVVVTAVSDGNCRLAQSSEESERQVPAVADGKVGVVSSIFNLFAVAPYAAISRCFWINGNKRIWTVEGLSSGSLASNQSTRFWRF